MDKHAYCVFAREMAMRILCSLLAVALVVRGLDVPAFAQSPEREWRETRRLCPALRDLDFARLDTNDAWRVRARETLRATDQPQLGDADIVLRFFAPPMFGGEGASTWTIARRVNGAWFVRREDYHRTGAYHYPDPFILDFRARRPQSPITIYEGRLSAALVATIESALADPCFAREPDLTPSPLPLRGGDDEICYDGPPFFLQVERAEGVLTRAQVCQTRWLTGAVLRALESGAMEEGGTVTQTLTPLILVDEQGNNIPEAEAPPPVTITLHGAGGRAVTLRFYESDNVTPAAADSLTWRVWPRFGEPPETWSIAIDGCRTPVTGAWPADGTTITVEARGCRLNAIEAGPG